MPKDKTSNDNSKTAKGTSQSDVEEKFKEIFGRYPQSSPVAQSTSQEDVEKKFEGLTGRPPGRFPEDMPLEERVSEIGKENKALQAQRSQRLKSKMAEVAELSQKLESQKGRVAEEARQNLERLDRQLERDGIVLDEKVTKPHSDEKFQEAANTPRKVTAEGKNFEQGTKTTEASVQPSINSQGNAAETSSVDKPQTAGKKTAEQTKEDSTPQPQENQKEEGIWSMFKRFVKKVLEKLLGDEENIGNTHDAKETPQRNTPNNGTQQRSQQQNPYQRGNEKNTQTPQRNAPNNEVQQSKASSININGKEFNLEPGEPFNHKSPGLEVSVMHGHQQSQQQNPNYGKILEQHPDATKGLKQVGNPSKLLVVMRLLILLQRMK